MATYLNKNSQYISSLVDYILDTKPYHSKLTEIVEEYQFFDEMAVKIEERTSVRTKIDPVWLYNYFSSGNTSFRTMPLKQLHIALNQVWPSNANSLYPGAIKAFRDENTDLASMPYVYSKKTFDGVGVADVLIERNGNRAAVEPMVEGLDFFQSHGSFQFRVKQTSDANSNFVPSWTEVRNENIVSTAMANTRLLANDLSNPASASSQILALLLVIQAHFAVAPPPAGSPSQIAAEVISRAGAATELNVLLNGGLNYAGVPTVGLNNIVLNTTQQLPSDYEFLLNSLMPDLPNRLGMSPPTGYTNWVGNDGVPDIGPVPPRSLYVDEHLSNLSPSLYFNLHSDFSTRESGQAEYPDVSNQYIEIKNIQATPSAVAGDTWTVSAQSSSIPFFHVYSSISGFIGSFVAVPLGSTFITATLSFEVKLLLQPPIGEELLIKNRNRLVFGPTALLETWDIIKVNPLAYSRPAFLSTRYGYIEDQFGVNGLVTLLDPSLPTGTIVLTCNASGTTFNLTSTVEPLYIGVATVDAPFNDGRLAFTIRSGSSQPFLQNDKFFIEIENNPAEAVDLDLGYGYDLDSYDNPNLNYDVIPAKVNFVFDTRFTDYNLANLGLVVNQTAVSGRKWRMMAIPDLGSPIATIKKDGSGPTESIDLQDATTGFPPDPALNAAPLFSMLGDSNPLVDDLRLFYATSFNLEYSDDDFNTVVSAGVVPVGAPFTSVLHGISFTIVPGSKPFVAVLSDDGILNPIVEGGDVFSFKVLNDPPMLTEAPIGLSSSVGARLVMHGDGFHEVLPASWTITFTSNTDYTVNGIQTEGMVGQPVPGGPTSGTLTTPGIGSREGNSFNGLGVHFTVVPGTVGLDIGDSFTFRTYSRKPSYLVHGSGSGWKEPAVVGESYWNGEIGFRLELPTAKLFDSTLAEPLIQPIAENTWIFGGGTLALTRIRFDAPNLIYSLIPTPIGSLTPTGWYVHRSDIGGVGHLSRTGSFTDTYTTITANFPSASVKALKLEITADDFMLTTAQDVVILNPTSSARLPTANDFVLIDKRTSDFLAINLDYTSVVSIPDLTPLALESIDPQFIDTFTGYGGIPIEATSPETIILQKWIPLTIESHDSNTSIAEFSDSAVSHNVFASGSGQQIGTLRNSTTNPMWPAEFEWDLTFFSTYLPLNSSSNIVTYGSGFRDVVNARITETLNFLVDGGALTSDFMFNDDFDVSIAEQNNWDIAFGREFPVVDPAKPWKLNVFDWVNEQPTISIQDDPFGGFLPGYDNFPYDDEPYGYDSGIPLVDHFLEAQQLAGITPQTAAQLAMTVVERQNRLAALIGMIGVFLNNGDIFATPLIDVLLPVPQTGFLTNLATDPISAASIATSGFGVPARGLGIDIAIGVDSANSSNPATDGAGADVQDALVIIANDVAYDFEAFRFDIGGLDAQGERIALIYSGDLPPVPNPLPALTTYADFETPLAVVGDDSVPGDFQARAFEINFRVTTGNLAFIQAMPNPKVFIWLPSWPAPQQVAIVEKIGTGKYRVSTPSATEAKFYLQPGP